MSRRARLVAASAVILCASMIAVGALDRPEHHIPTFLALMAAATAAWWVAASAARGLGAGPRAVAGVLIVAVIVRAVLLPAEPSLSTDVYRYVWEGRMVLHGINPYVHAPSEPALAAYRDAWSARINHPDLVTIYPPLAQGLFALAARVHDAPVTHKAVFVMFDLAAALVLAAHVRRGRAGLDALVLYAWSPLVIVETARAGHVDAVGASLLLVAVLAMARGREAGAALAMAASVLAKLAGAVLAPWMLLRRRAAGALALAALVVAAGYAPFASAGRGLVSSLVRYGRAWEFNGPAYRLVTATGLGGDTARALLGIAALVVVFVLAARERDPVRYARRAIGAVLVLSPTVYPWYVVWLVPLLALDPSRAWMALVATVPLSYTVWMRRAAGGPWRMTPEMLVLEYGPFLALLAWQWRERARSPRPNGAEAAP